MSHLHAPWTDLGGIQQEVRSLESKISHKADAHEVSRLESKVSGIERDLQRVEANITDLQQQFVRILERLEQLEAKP